MHTTTIDTEGAPPQAPAGADPPEASAEEPFLDKVVKRQLAFESKKKGEEKGDSGAIAATETAKPKARAAARRESVETERNTSRGNREATAMRITVR